MCRLLGVVSATPIIVADAVGDDVLKDFVALTKIHGDGWGVAAVGPPGDTPHVRCRRAARSTTRRSSRPPTTCGPSASIVHLRWATNGLAVQPQNSHPFVADGLAMAHNGSIKPMARWTTCSNPASPRRCAAPPTASGTSG